MNRLFAYLARFATITLGYACAALAASVFFHVLMLGGIGPLEDDARDVTFYAALVSVPVVALLIAYTAFLPAFAYFVIAEIAGWRSWMVHAIAGGLVTAVSFSAHSGGVGGLDGASGQLAILLIACGMVGGVAYWSVAGRRAGAWLEDDRIDDGSPLHRDD